MANWREIITWRLEEGASTTRDGTTVTPLARILAIRWPGGGLLRAWPAGVIVQHDGSRRRVPIVDITRALRLGILGIGIWWLIAHSVRQRNIRQRREDHA